MCSRRNSYKIITNIAKSLKAFFKHALGPAKRKDEPYMTDNEMVTLDEMGDIKEDMLKLEKS